MGSCGSKSTLETVDDSVHVMLKHDQKAAMKKGKAPQGYVPRAEHPLLHKAQQDAKKEIAAEEKASASASANASSPKTENTAAESAGNNNNNEKIEGTTAANES